MNPHVETVNLLEKSLASTLKKNRDEKKYYENLLAIRQLTDKQKFVIEKTLDCISETIDFLEIFEIEVYGLLTIISNPELLLDKPKCKHCEIYKNMIVDLGYNPIDAPYYDTNVKQKKSWY